MFKRHPWLVRCAAVLFVALPVLASGCGKPAATVSGKVTYQGRPLPIGTIRFLTAENKVLAADISGDGDYSIPRVPPGEVKISVSVPSANTLKPQQKGMYGKAGDNPASETSTSAPRLMKIPDQYGAPESSGLKYTVTAEANQTHNIELK
jgi:hypothetical protein